VCDIERRPSFRFFDALSRRIASRDSNLERSRVVVEFVVVR